MGLYDDIGNKIKNWAMWIFIIESIGAVITGFVFLISWGFEDAWWALLTIIFGPVIAYVSTWTLYALGQLVDDTAEIRIQLTKLNTYSIAEILNLSTVPAFIDGNSFKLKSSNSAVLSVQFDSNNNLIVSTEVQFSITNPLNKKLDAIASKLDEVRGQVKASGRHTVVI